MNIQSLSYHQIHTLLNLSHQYSLEPSAQGKVCEPLGFAHKPCLEALAGVFASAAASLSTKHMKIRATPVPRIFNDKPSHFVHQPSHFVHQTPDSVDKPYRKHQFVHQMPNSVDKPSRKHQFVHQNLDSVDKPSRSATSSLKIVLFKDEHGQKCEFVLKIA